MSPHEVRLDRLIEPAPFERAGDRDLPILSITMREGLVDQATKFKKRVASTDTVDYKLVRRNQLVVGFPIDEGVLSFQDLYNEAVVSPAYDVWNLREDFEIESAYLERFLRSPRAIAFYRAKLRGTTARRRTLPDDVFLKLSVPVPPLLEQRRITKVLDQAEALQAKRRAALAQLDTVTQSVFLDMFGDPAANPKDWPVRTLEELGASFRYGTSNKSANVGRPALRIPNVVGGSIDLADLKLVPVTDDEFDRLRLSDGDLLFVRTNGNPNFVGRCALFNSRAVRSSGFEAEHFIFASYLIRARISSNQIVPIFLREFLLGAEGRRQLRVRCKTSAGQYNINVEGLAAIAVPVPTRNLQQEFADRVKAIERFKLSHRMGLAKFDRLFASLEHRAFQGGL